MGTPEPPPRKHQHDTAYDANKRVRRFQVGWRTHRPWLRYDDASSTMWCTICKANAHRHADANGNFAVGTKSLQLTSVKSHEVTSSHKRESAAADAATRPAMESVAGRMLVSMNKALVDKLKLKFRTVHALAKHARPYTDYVWQCSVDERKGLIIGTDYRSDKSASEFAHHIAEVSHLVFLVLFLIIDRWSLTILRIFTISPSFRLEFIHRFIAHCHILSDGFSPDNP